VTLDLGTHDLDIMRYLFGQEFYRVVGVSRRWTARGAGSSEDSVLALLQFGGGGVGVLEADRLSPVKLRELRVVGNLGIICADYQTQSGYVHKAGGVEHLNPANEEPLKRELTEFIAAVRGEGRPAATGKDGLEALVMVEEILNFGMTGSEGGKSKW